MRAAFLVLRAGGAIAGIAAVVGQLVTSYGYWSSVGARDLSVTVANVFSYFTVQSNLIAAVALAIGAVLLLGGSGEDPRWFGVLRACATTYLVTTGVVYNLLLRGIELPPGSVSAWSNEILHLAMPVLLLVDWLFAPGRRRLGWGALGAVVSYPIVWAVYTLVRGPFVWSDARGRQGWYPYPFLDPGEFENGYGTVALYVLGIAVFIAAVGCGVVAVSRMRRR